MLIVISKVTVRKGHFEKVIPLVEANAKYAMEQPGLIEGYLSRGVDNHNEILVYSRWQNQDYYNDAKKRLKQDPRSTKLMFQCLPHVTKHESSEYEIFSVNT